MLFLHIICLARCQVPPRCLDVGIESASLRLNPERPHALIVEYIVHLFQGLAATFLKEQKYVYQRCQAESAEDAVDPPLDVFEARRREECQRKVADPVSGRGKRDRLAAYVERNDFCGIKPTGWSMTVSVYCLKEWQTDIPPGRRICRNEEIGTRNNGLGSR